MAVNIKKSSKKAAAVKYLEQVTGHPVTGVLSKKHKDGGAEDSTTDEGFVVATKPMCYVTMRAGKTTNLGNFESVKFEVSLSHPCIPGEEDETFLKTKGWVDSKLASLIEELETAIVDSGKTKE
jgi:hypothetical protein